MANHAPAPVPPPASGQASAAAPTAASSRLCRGWMVFQVSGAIVGLGAVALDANTPGRHTVGPLYRCVATARMLGAAVVAAG